MKKWLIYKVIGLTTAVLLLAGCVIVINQATPEEKELMAIQTTIGQQISDVGQKVTSDQYSPAQKEGFISQANDTISQALQRIQELNIPAKTKQFAEQTKKYLASAQDIFLKMKEFVTTVNLNDLQLMGEEKLQEVKKTFTQYVIQLNKLSQQINSARKQIEELAAAK
jgi:DNA repair ATPase RecN